MGLSDGLRSFLDPAWTSPTGKLAGSVASATLWRPRIAMPGGAPFGSQGFITEQVSIELIASPALCSFKLQNQLGSWQREGKQSPDWLCKLCPSP